jgi:[ribosomal protein S18]-alanine N-acetyltransferase
MSAVLKQPKRIVRSMRVEDLGQVTAIEIAAYAFPWTEGIFRDCLRVGYSCWVLESFGDVLGYGIMSIAYGESHVLNLCVNPQHQGHGHGRELLRRLLDLSERYADTAFLEVRPSNAVALDLYLSEGFNEVGRRKGYYPAQRGREDAVILAKAFRSPVR